MPDAPDTLERIATRLPLGKKILFALIPILVFLGIAEGVLRLTVGLKQLRYKCHYPLLDNQYCPNMEAVKDSNGMTIRTNSDGLLDREYTRERAPGTFRIAVLGDSFTAGEEVEDGREFHALWETELTRRLGYPVEVINFGVGGIGPWRELQTYHLRAREYHPDLTVLALYWENDFDNAMDKYKSGDPNPLNEEYPVESFKQRAQMVRKSINQWLWNNLALYQFSHTRYHLLEHQFHVWFQPEWRKDPAELKKQTARETKSGSGTKPAPVDNELLKRYPPLPGYPPVSKPARDLPTSLDDPWFFDSESWGLVKKLLLKLRQEVEADGGRLIVMHFLAEEQYKHRHPLPMAEFNRFLTQNGIGAIDPNPVFFQMPLEELNRQYVPGDIHFNENGHAHLAWFSMDYMEQAVRKQAQRSPALKAKSG